MNLQEHGKKLIEEAQSIYTRDLQSAIETKDYNIAIRRAHEAVELSLKGALKIMDTDYPKIHDVGIHFAKQAREKKPGLFSKDVLERIEAVSLWLSQVRTTSFYFEKSYSEENAKNASADAAFVLEQVQKLLVEPA